MNSKYHRPQLETRLYSGPMRVLRVIDSGSKRPIKIIVREYSARGARVSDLEIFVWFAGRLDTYDKHKKVEKKCFPFSLLFKLC